MNNLRGMALMTISMLGFAIQDALIKHLSSALSVGVIVLTIGICGFPVFAILAWRRGYKLLTPALLHPSIIIRNIADILGAFGFSAALWLIPLATASAIFMTIPLLVTLAAAVFLGEKVGLRRWSAILVGFVGMLIIIRPGTAAFDPNALLALLAAVALSGRDLCARLIPDGVGHMQLGAWGFAMIGVAGLCLMPFSDTPALDAGLPVFGLAAATITGIIAYYTINLAMRSGDVAVVAPFRYTRLLFAIAIGLWVFSEVPDQNTLIGAALILGSGLYSVARERKLSRSKQA